MTLVQHRRTRLPRISSTGRGLRNSSITILSSEIRFAALLRLRAGDPGANAVAPRGVSELPCAQAGGCTKHLMPHLLSQEALDAKRSLIATGTEIPLRGMQ